jgi:phosphonate transport system substrate-binding protein
MNLLRTWLTCVGILFATAVFAAGGNSNRPLRVGMLPSLSLQKLFERFKPLQKYLEQTLHRPVVLLTAIDYATYMQRASQYEYDLYFAAPHMAALAEMDDGYRRVSMMTRDLRGYLVTRAHGRIKRVEDLKGHTISAPQELAIITIMGEALLEEHHLQPGRDVTIDYTSTHNNAILALTTGKTDAAIVSAPIFEIISRDLNTKLTILDTTKTASHLMFMASPKLSQHEYEQLCKAMLNFRADGAGKEFFRRSPYGDSGKIRDEDMANMRPYVEMLKRHLAKLKVKP